jgi:hypothetical protein
VTPLTNIVSNTTLAMESHSDPTESTRRKCHMNKAAITISVPEAGKRYFGLSRNGSYDAAARGEIPVIKIGRLKRVPVRALEMMIERASEPSK